MGKSLSQHRVRKTSGNKATGSATARIPVIAAVLISALIVSCASTVKPANSSLKAVDSLDPARYAGTWYEIARLPNRFQNQCQGNVTATYEMDGLGGLSVVNRCLTRDGKTDEAIGRARRVDESQAKLKVSFLPSLLSKLTWLPFGWGDYWVLDLPADYSHAMVGSPDNQFLWILSRSPQMQSAAYSALISKASAMGYSTGKLVRTAQGI